MRRAITAPLSSHGTSHPLLDRPGAGFCEPKPSLLCLLAPVAVGGQKDTLQRSQTFWRKLFSKKEFSEQKNSCFNYQSPDKDQDLSDDGCCNEPTDRIMFSERFEEYLRGRMRLRDILDPHLINSLLKILFNVIMGIIVLVVVGYALFMLREDIMKKKAYQLDAILVEINQCTKEYFDNKCEYDTRLDPIKDFCVEKEKCMLQDPMLVVQGTKLTSALLAEAINEFIDPLGWKSILVVLFAFFGSIYVVNKSLGTSHSAQDFRRTSEYDDVLLRLQRMEQFSAQKERFCIPNEGRGQKSKIM